jgi:hypothetical protein
MLSVRRLLIVLIFSFAIPAVAQQSAPSAPVVDIMGKVQSFSGNILDVKPPTAPAVWIVIPDDLHADRGALKEGVSVDVKAYWNVLCYMGKEVIVK